MNKENARRAAIRRDESEWFTLHLPIRCREKIDAMRDRRDPEMRFGHQIVARAIDEMHARRAAQSERRKARLDSPRNVRAQ